MRAFRDLFNLIFRSFTLFAIDHSGDPTALSRYIFLRNGDVITCLSNEVYSRKMIVDGVFITAYYTIIDDIPLYAHDPLVQMALGNV